MGAQVSKAWKLLGADATSRRVIQTVIRHRELVWNLVSREVKVRYHGSILGLLWTLLIPLFMAGIYIVFLRVLGGSSVPVAEIIIGVFAWQFTIQSVNGGLGAILNNANLVKKVSLPREVLPASNTLANLATYLLSLLVQFPVVFVLMAKSGQPVSGQLWAFPLIIALQLVFNLGLALLLSSAVVYFRDLNHLAGVFTSAWFFVSPVMYTLAFVEPFAKSHPILNDLFMLNPMAVIITAYRSVCIAGVAMPLGWATWTAVGIIFATYFGGRALFTRLQKNFADLL